ncbi:serine/threonine-protein kinase, partial [Streptomyces palmae]
MQPLGAEDPREIGTYRLLGRLGTGGMGRVYLGRSVGGRTVAVKVVHPHLALDEEFRTRFHREVKAARQVGGGWTAPVLDADPQARVPWVATGYVAGPALNQAVSETGPLPESTVRALAAGLAEALGTVHGLGLVHRDVKPSNVLLALDGPRLIDFGIARATAGTASLTATGVSIGSPGYMSPEQILGTPATGAADVFSLGAVLAFAATGDGPFQGDSSASLLYKVVHEEAVLGPGLTSELRELVVCCLAKDPADRPTPEQILERLAPGGGAAGLVRPGWLPAPLVERISRQAVELLDLEAAAPVREGPRSPGEGTTEAEPGAEGAASTGRAGGPAEGAADPGRDTAAVAGGAAPPAADPAAAAASAGATLGSGPVAAASAGETVGSGPVAAASAGGDAAPGDEAPASGGAAGSETLTLRLADPRTGPALGVFGPPTPSHGTKRPAEGAPVAGLPAEGLPVAGTPAEGAHVAGLPAGGPSVAGTPAGGPPVAGPPRAAHPAVGVPYAAGASSAAGATAGPPGDGVRQADRTGPTDGESKRSGRRLALFASLGGGNRPRALSCSLVLSVAGALAVVTGAAVVFDVLPGSGSDASKDA